MPDPGRVASVGGSQLGQVISMVISDKDLEQGIKSIESAYISHQPECNHPTDEEDEVEHEEIER